MKGGRTAKLSLHPMSFNEAVVAVLKVKPEPETPKKAKAKKPAKTSMR